MKKRKSIILIGASVIILAILVCVGIVIDKVKENGNVLINENDLKIILTDVDYKKDELRLELAINNYGEDDMLVHCGTNGYNCNSINGYMNNEGYLNATVKAGSKETAVMTFSRDRLEMYGIDEIRELELGINIQNNTTKEYIYFSPIKITVSESKEGATITDTYNQYIQNVEELDYYVEEEIFNHNDIVVKSVAFISNEEGENTVLIEVDNNSSEIAYGTISDVVVNGLVLPEMEEKELRINPGKTRIFEYSLSDVMNTEKCKILGIDKIGEFKCNLTLKDSDNVSEQASINIVNPEVNRSLDTSGTEVYNEKGISIISKGIVKDYDGNDDYAHVLLLIKNNYSGQISVTNRSSYMHFDDGSIEIEMPTYEIPSGYSILHDFEINIRWIEESDIEVFEDIKTAELSLRIMDENKEVISEPEIIIH